MRKRIILFLILALLSCYSCINEKKETVSIPIIDLEAAMNNLYNKKMNFSEFVDSITYLALETNDSCVIDNRIFLAQNITANYIFHGNMMFSRDGSFIRKLGKVGQGPGEYTLALDSKVDERRQEFYVYSNDSRNFYIYNLENQFIRKIPGRFEGGKAFILLDSCNILLERDFWGYYKGFNEYQVINNKTGAVIYKRENLAINKEYLNKSLPQNSFWRYNNEIFYFENLTDTIFKLKENGEISSHRFIIKLGKYGNRDEDKTLLRVCQIVECSKFIFFSITYKKFELYYAAYNKITGELRMNKYDRFFNNDIDGGFLWLYNDTYDNKLGFKDIFPSLAKEKFKLQSSQSNGYDKGKNQKLRQFINELDEDDNNIYYFYHLK